MGETAPDFDAEVGKILRSAFEGATSQSFMEGLLREGGRVFLDDIQQLTPEWKGRDPTVNLRLATRLQEMAWEKLHTGNWQDVPLAWRDAYTLACLITASAKLGSTDKQSKGPLTEAMRELDMAVMMGGPQFRSLADAFISALQSAHQAEQKKQETHSPGDQPPAKRLRLSNDRPQNPANLPLGSLLIPQNLLATVSPPALESFLTDYMAPEQPVVLKGAIEHWPAREKWQDFGYLMSLAGHRTVPVEVGQHYLAESWGQQMMLLSDFITQHLQGGGEKAGQQSQMVYLAQHPLLDQIPELQRDIVEPDYCCLGEGEIQAVNAWFGPAGTIYQAFTFGIWNMFGRKSNLKGDINQGPVNNQVTPLHYDPHHNLLAQVVGRKYVRLYPPSASPQLQPFESGQHTNSSQIDLDDPETAEKHPGLKTLPFRECVLEPGQMLYIPPRHWHYVRSLDVSFSVTFWWQ